MQISASFQEIYVSILSVATLLGLGLGLTLGQISATIRAHWKILIWGVVFNFVIIPAFALGIRDVIHLEPAFFIGFFLCMAAPGGGTGSLLTLVAKGDIPFSVALMFLLTLVSLFATPLLMVIAAPVSNGASPWLAVLPMVTTLIMYILTPLAIGLGIRRYWPPLAQSLVKSVTRLSMIMLVVLVVGYLIMKWDQLAVGGLTLIMVSVVFACLALAGGLTVPANAGLRRSMGFTSSVRNVTLAILLASTSYPDPHTMIAVLAYGLAQYVVSFPAAILVARRAGNKQIVPSV